MGEIIEGFFLFLLVAIFIAVAVGVVCASIAAIAAVAAAIYAALLPFSYLRTLYLLPRAALSADDALVDRAVGATENGGMEDGDREVDEPDERLSFPSISDSLAEAVRHIGRDLRDPPQPRSAWASNWLAGHKDHGIAKPSYFFGPVADDVEAVIWGCAKRCRTCFMEGICLVRGMVSEAASAASAVEFVIAAGILIGLVAGGVAGLVLTATLAVLNLVVTIVITLGALFVCAALRLLDTIRRLVYKVRMPCPACHKPMAPYPAYLCPGCSESHKDIRPGVRGIAFRNCECQARFKTSLLIGAVKLVAECPGCGARLPSRFGVAPEIVIPFFGGLNAGKTQLMYTLAKTLHILVTVSGGSIEFEDDAKERLDRIETDLAINGRPDKTLPETPRAYILRLTLGPQQRLIFLFDAAGELHYSQSGLSQLNYLDKARVLVFVADPLAADDLWAQIPAQSQEELAKIRSARAESELAYQKTRDHMRRMGSKKKYSRLALVVSKADLLEEAGIMSVPQMDESSVRDLVQRRRGLDMADEMREATQSFAAVKFFHTAAIMGDLGLPDPSVEKLVRWLMLAEGIQLGQWMNNGA